MNKIIAVDNQNTSLDTLSGSVMEYLKNSQSDNTHKAYQSDWNSFIIWLNKNHIDFQSTINSETIAKYISYLADSGYKVSTISRALVAIHKTLLANNQRSYVHTLLVKQTLAGIKRTLGIAKNQKSPIRTKHIITWINGLSDDLSDKRNKALILIGFTGAFRRSELISLNVEDCEFSENGLIINIRHSKTDQLSSGRKIAIPYTSTSYCPVKALQDYLQSANINSGAIFTRILKGNHLTSDRLTDKSVALIVKSVCKTIGLDANDFSGHSLRAGFITESISNGAREFDVMKQSGHKSVEVFRTYVRNTNLFQNNSVNKLGL